MFNPEQIPFLRTFKFATNKMQTCIMKIDTLVVGFKPAAWNFEVQSCNYSSKEQIFLQSCHKLYFYLLFNLWQVRAFVTQSAIKIHHL